MNEDVDQIETALRCWRPREVRDDLTRRVALDLECPPRPPLTWWRALGFNHPLAAGGWGLTVPALVVLTTLLANQATTPVPATKPAVSGSELTDVWQTTHATNRRFQTDDEGVVLDAAQRPVRRTRYRSEDTVAWRNPQTGAVLEVSYPREDVVTTPITMR